MFSARTHTPQSIGHLLPVRCTRYSLNCVACPGTSDYHQKRTLRLFTDLLYQRATPESDLNSESAKKSSTTAERSGEVGDNFSGEGRLMNHFTG